MSAPTNRNKQTEKFREWLLEHLDVFHDGRVVAISDPADDYETVDVQLSDGTELRISIEDLSLPSPRHDKDS